MHLSGRKKVATAVPVLRFLHVPPQREELTMQVRTTPNRHNSACRVSFQSRIAGSARLCP
jgi:hypothetical protein